jgi:molecular chaperone GrpE
MNETGRIPRRSDSGVGPDDGDARPDGAPRENASAAEPAAGSREEEAGMAEESSAAPTVAGSEPVPDYKDRWLRAEAELQNFRRRAARDGEETRRAAEESVLLEMVSALDDLDRALEGGAAQSGGAGWLEGVALVAQGLRDGLARRGVTPEDPIGGPFDPVFHEAMLEVDAPAGVAAGTVVQVVHRGYRRGNRALRPARVVVARAATGSSG